MLPVNPLNLFIWVWSDLKVCWTSTERYTGADYTHNVQWHREHVSSKLAYRVSLACEKHTQSRLKWINLSKNERIHRRSYSSVLIVRWGHSQVTFDVQSTVSILSPQKDRFICSVLSELVINWLMNDLWRKVCLCAWILQWLKRTDGCTICNLCVWVTDLSCDFRVCLAKVSRDVGMTRGCFLTVRE